MVATLAEPSRRTLYGSNGMPKKEGKWTIKVNDDLGEMISWISKLTGKTVAVYLDPIIRDQVEKDFKAISREVEVIKKAQSKHRQVKTEEDD